MANRGSWKARETGAKKQEDRERQGWRELGKMPEERTESNIEMKKLNSALQHVR
jgi:hypothetical protein